MLTDYEKERKVIYTKQIKLNQVLNKDSGAIVVDLEKDDIPVKMNNFYDTEKIGKITEYFSFEVEENHNVILLSIYSRCNLM